MPTTRTVGVGKDHSTIGSAISYMQANHNFNTDGIATVSVEENAEFKENINVTGISGTPSVAAYFKLTVPPANRHAGIASTGHARMRSVGNAATVNFNLAYTFTEYLDLQLDTSALTRPVFEVNATLCLISRCIIWTDLNPSGQDGIFAGNVSIEVSVDHCAIYGFSRVGLYAEKGINGITQTWNIDYCTVFDCGSSGGIRMFSGGASGVITANVYNTYVSDSGGEFDGDYQETPSLVVWAGANNASSDASLTTIGLTTNAQENLTVTDELVNVTAGSEDFHVKNASASIHQTGVSRVGSEPDTRQDFSFDWEGTVRSTAAPEPDIGADEIVVDVILSRALTDSFDLSDSYTLESQIGVDTEAAIITKIETLKIDVEILQ